MDLVLVKPHIYVPLAALAYGAATFGMKSAATGASVLAIALIVGGFMVAAMAEIQRLRRAAGAGLYGRPVA